MSTTNDLSPMSPIDWCRLESALGRSLSDDEQQKITDQRARESKRREIHRAEEAQIGGA